MLILQTMDNTGSRWSARNSVHSLLYEAAVKPKLGYQLLI